MHFWQEYGIFLLETITMVLAILFVFGGILALAKRGKAAGDGDQIQLSDLSQQYRDDKNELLRDMCISEHDKACYKEFTKQLKQQRKQHKHKLFVFDFKGDLRATGVQQLQTKVNAVLQVAKNDDEILVRLESSGGMVPAYGLAAAELARIRQHKLKLTVAVDKVAASGGYLMAVVANKILAAPFAFIGSIGVIGQLPNFHKLLHKHDIDFEQHTAGEYKRSITLFGKNTDKAREKFQEELELIHALFKEFIHNYRPHLDLNKIATGEYWLAKHAEKLHLVDELMTSSEYILQNLTSKQVYLIDVPEKKSFGQKISKNFKILGDDATNLIHKLCNPAQHL